MSLYNSLETIGTPQLRSEMDDEDLKFDFKQIQLPFKFQDQSTDMQKRLFGTSMNQPQTVQLKPRFGDDWDQYNESDER